MSAVNTYAYHMSSLDTNTCNFIQQTMICIHNSKASGKFYRTLSLTLLSM